MPSVFVLYLQDEIVAPHLELLRNVCEPESKSRPHITVRYFNKLAVPKDYLTASVDHIDLLDIDAFGIDDDSQQSNRTVFIRCQSDALLRFEHKPSFPTSQFHVTLYDGTSDEFAKALLKRLEKYTLNIRVPLPAGTSLTQIQLKPKRKSHTASSERQYPSAIAKLFKEISGKSLNFEYLASLSQRQRLALVDAIFTSLKKSTAGYAGIVSERVEQIEAQEKELAYEMHLTPPELAAEMSGYALSLLDEQQKRRIDFGDPAVGTGAFFGALLATTSQVNVRSAVGIDISPTHVAAARWRWADRGMEVIQADYLHLGTLSQRNLVLANPPYLRHQEIPADYKHELRQRATADLGMRISGRSGQYIYFLLLSHKWMAPQAVAAWLIPSEFMQTSYGQALRYYLTRRVQLVRIHQFAPEDRQFENAETLPCVVVFRNSSPDPTQKVLFTVGGTLLQPTRSNEVGLHDLSPETKWTPLPRPPRVRDSSFVRLGDLFDVRRGIATGANEFFILERSKAEELGIPSLAVKPILPKAKTLASDVIEGYDDGYPKVERQLCVLDLDVSESEVQEKFPRLMKYLETAEETGIRKRHLVARRRPWYKQERRDPALFLCTYMGKAHADKPAIRFLLNKSKAIATNTYLMLYPKVALQRLIESDHQVIEQIFDLLKDASWNAMHEFARTHAGGLSKIEPRELQEVWLGPVADNIRAAATIQLFS